MVHLSQSDFGQAAGAQCGAALLDALCDALYLGTALEPQRRMQLQVPELAARQAQLGGTIDLLACEGGRAGDGSHFDALFLGNVWVEGDAGGTKFLGAIARAKFGFGNLRVRLEYDAQLLGMARGLHQRRR